jgi:hypothetical protein
VQKDFCNKICHKRTHAVQQRFPHSITSLAIQLIADLAADRELLPKNGRSKLSQWVGMSKDGCYERNIASLCPH